MTDQLRDLVKRNTSTEAVRDEAVAHDVRRERAQGEPLLPAVEQPLDHAEAVDEAAVRGLGDQALERRHDGLRDRHVAVAGLAVDEQVAALQVHVADAEADNLGAPQPGAPEHLDDVRVPAVRDLRDRVLDFGRRHRLEAAHANPRQLQADERVDGDRALHHGEARDSAEGPEFLLHDRRVADALGASSLEVVADRGRVDVAEARAGAHLADDVAESARVVGAGAVAAAGVPEVLQERPQPIFERHRPLRHLAVLGVSQDVLGPLGGELRGREGGAVAAAVQDVDDGAKASEAVPADERWKAGRSALLGHGCSEGAKSGATCPRGPRGRAGARPSERGKWWGWDANTAAARPNRGSPVGQQRRGLAALSPSTARSSTRGSEAGFGTAGARPGAHAVCVVSRVCRGVNRAHTGGAS